LRFIAVFPIEQSTQNAFNKKETDKTCMTRPT
jgi:hypothetical protein